MAVGFEKLDLRSLDLASGQAQAVEAEVAMQAFSSSGQRYQAIEPTVMASIHVSRTTGGWALRLSLVTDVRAPCARCLAEATERLDIDAREIDQDRGGAELSSPYVHDGELDMVAWVRDAMILAAPSRLLCEEECRGLCSICGANLNLEPSDHHHEESLDPRWQKLRQISL